MGIGLEVIIVLLLIVLNGVFAMSELALVSARRARLAVLERKGVPGATTARELADDPQRFLPTVQVGITLVSMLTGVFGGARIASDVQAWLADRTGAGAGGRDAVAGTGGGGDDLPDAGARRTGAEAPRAAPSGARGRPRGAGDRLDGARQRSRGLAARQVVRRGAAPVRPASRAAPDRDRGGAEGAAGRGRAGRRAGDRGARHDRARAAAGRQAGARDHDAAHRDRLDRPHRSAEGDRRGAEIRAAFALRGVRRLGRQRGRRGAGEGHPGPHPRRRRPVAGRRLAPADRGARHGDGARRAGAAEIRPARDRAGDGRIRQLRGRGDRGGRAGGDRRRSDRCRDAAGRRGRRGRSAW